MSQGNEIKCASIKCVSRERDEYEYSTETRHEGSDTCISSCVIIAPYLDFEGFEPFNLPRTLVVRLVRFWLIVLNLTPRSLGKPG